MKIVEIWRPEWKCTIKEITGTTLITDCDVEVKMIDLTKRKPIRSKAIRDAANGESCTVCGRNDGTTVFCHLNESWAGKGMGQKADDIAGFFGCHLCHMEYDNDFSALANDPGHMTIMRAMYRTWRRLYELGVIQIKGSDNG